MSVKTKALLFRNLLYVKEVADTGSISLAAQKNGIKTSNLSKLIKETEILLGKVLFERTAHGVKPTFATLDLISDVYKMEECLNACISHDDSHEKILRLYVSKGLRVRNLDMFETVVLMADEEKNADVCVCSYEPKGADELVSTECRLGKDVVQSVWVCAQNTPQAIALARFIILQIQNQ